MQPFLSVLIPVCNQVGKMDKCIESLKNQTFTDFEVIFVDDGSKDESFKMLTDYAKEDSRMKVLKHDGNKSLMVARYTAMKEANGDYIFFLDSDDWIEESAFNDLYLYLSENKVDVVRFGFIFEPSKKESMPAPNPNPLEAYMKGEDYAAIWKRCYSKKVIKEAIDRIEPFYCNMGEDTFYSGVLLSCADTYGIMNKAIYHYDTAGMSNTKQTVSVEKYKRDLKSVTESKNNLMRFLEKYNKDYVDLANNATTFMRRYVAGMAIINETDYVDIVNRLLYLKNEEFEDLYEFISNKVLRYKFKKEIYSSYKELENIPLPSLKDIMEDK